MVASETPVVRRTRIVTPELLAVICIVGLASMAMALLQPVLPLYLTGLGVKPALLGLMFSTGMLGMVFGESSGGWLADRVGIKAPLLVGTFLCAPLVLSFVFVTSPVFIFLVFFTWGIVRAAIFGPGRGYIGVKVPLDRKATMMALYGMSMAAFRGLGTLASGLIADNLGYRWVFYAAAGVGVLAGIPVLFWVKKQAGWGRDVGGQAEAVARVEDTGTAETGVVSLFRQRSFITQSAIALFYFAAIGLGAFVSLLGVEVAGLAATQVGVLFTIGAVTNAVMLMPMGRLADMYSKRNMMIIGLLITGAGQAVVGLSHGFPQMAAGMMIQSVGGATFGPAAVALLSENIGRKRQNTAMGIYGGCEDAGAILGSGMAGVVWTGLGPVWVFVLVGSVSAAIGAAITFFLVREKDNKKGRVGC
jgi:MFS transporter, PPP family, 3-phenylpropionic acid transporter